MAMKSDDTALFREIQRSAQKGMRVIETILPKVADDPFSLYLNGKLSAARTGYPPTL